MSGLLCSERKQLLLQDLHAWDQEWTAATVAGKSSLKGMERIHIMQWRWKVFLLCDPVHYYSMPGPAKSGISLAYALVNTCLAHSKELWISHGVHYNSYGNMW